MARRRPQGYIGTHHETIGSDIVAVLRALDALGTGGDGKGTNAAQRVLGFETAKTLADVNPNGWYPIEMLLGLLDTVHTKLGVNGLRKVGRTLFKLSHEHRVLQVAKSARDIVYGLDGMYNHANRGTAAIGGWKVVKFEPGHAEIDKTTPHLCYLEEGLLTQALSAVGTPTIVTQTKCLREGADLCRFELQSSVLDARWG